MQQAIYNSINGINGGSGSIAQAEGESQAADGTGLVRWMARRWDLVGVLALMGSSAAYGAFALAHLGF